MVNWWILPWIGDFFVNSSEKYHPPISPSSSFVYNILITFHGYFSKFLYSWNFKNIFLFIFQVVEIKMLCIKSSTKSVKYLASHYIGPSIHLNVLDLKYLEVVWLDFENVILRCLPILHPPYKGTFMKLGALACVHHFFLLLEFSFELRLKWPSLYCHKKVSNVVRQWLCLKTIFILMPVPTRYKLSIFEYLKMIKSPFGVWSWIAQKLW